MKWIKLEVPKQNWLLIPISVIQTNIHTHAHTYTLIHTYTYTHINTHKNTQMHKHTHAHTCLDLHLLSHFPEVPQMFPVFVSMFSYSMFLFRCFRIRGDRLLFPDKSWFRTNLIDFRVKLSQKIHFRKNDKFAKKFF